MPKVYILEEVYYYEGKYVIGVYSTPEEAKKAYNEVTDSYCDDLQITEWDLETQKNTQINA